MWRSIGIGLGVSYNDLEGLTKSCQSNQLKLEQVIQRWFDMNGKGEGTSVTWSTILDVVRGQLVKNESLAMTIYEYLKKESFVQQNTQSKHVIVSLVVRIIRLLHNNSMITTYYMSAILLSLKETFDLALQMFNRNSL